MSNDFISICPFCSRTNELATGVDHSKGKTPSDGSISMCMTCGELSIFDAATEGGLRRPTSDEYVGIAHDQTIRRMRAAWMAMREYAGAQS